MESINLHPAQHLCAPGDYWTASKATEEEAVGWAKRWAAPLVYASAPLRRLVFTATHTRDLSLLAELATNHGDTLERIFLGASLCKFSSEWWTLKVRRGPLWQLLAALPRLVYLDINVMLTHHAEKWAALQLLLSTARPDGAPTLLLGCTVDLMPVGIPEAVMAGWKTDFRDMLCRWDPGPLHLWAQLAGRLETLRISVILYRLTASHEFLHTLAQHARRLTRLCLKGPSPTDTILALRELFRGAGAGPSPLAERVEEVRLAMSDSSDEAGVVLLEAEVIALLEALSWAPRLRHVALSSAHIDPMLTARITSCLPSCASLSAGLQSASPFGGKYGAGRVRLQRLTGAAPSEGMELIEADVSTRWYKEWLRV